MTDDALARLRASAGKRLGRLPGVARVEVVCSYTVHTYLAADDADVRDAVYGAESDVYEDCPDVVFGCLCHGPERTGEARR